MKRKQSIIAGALLSAFVAAGAGAAIAQSGKGRVLVVEEEVSCGRLSRFASTVKTRPGDVIRMACLSDLSGRTVIRDEYRNKAGKLDRTGAPAVTETDLETGAVTDREFYTDGRYDGTPSIERYTEDGKPVYIAIHKNGQRNDGPDGAAAVRQYNSRGSLIRAEHWQDYKRVDGANGEAGVTEFNRDGIMTRAEHWRDGLRNDAPNGEPAVETFDDAGVLMHAESWKDGQLVKTLNDAELAALRKVKPAPAPAP